MSCPVCGFVNVAGAQVCAACGTQLVAEPKPLARPGDAVCARHKDTPALMPCARCGTFYCGACLERGSDGQMYCIDCRSRATLLPWDRRNELGTLRAWFQTCTKLLLEPQVTLANAPRDGTLSSSILFTLLSSVAGFITTLGLYAVAFGGVMIAGLAESKKLGGAEAGIGVGAMIGILIFYIGFIIGMQLVTLFVLAAIEHLVLHLLGEKNLAGYTTTVRAHALGLAPYMLGLVPVCGPFVMGLWSLVLRIFTLMHLQKVTAGKAVAAVLAPVVVLCGCFFLVYFLAIAAVLGASGLSR
jgi:hypothetical protein